MSVDGRRIIDWQGMPSRLSLSDDWKTPRDNALFVGAHDCRFRIYRVTLSPITGEGRAVEEENKPER